MSETLELFNRLSAQFKRKPRTPEVLIRCEEALRDLKIHLATCSRILPAREKPSLNIVELAMTRDMLEIAVQIAVYRGEMAAFERYIQQLETYYFDYRPSTTDGKLSPSAEMLHMLGLSLMWLLAANRLSEFHAALERIQKQVVAEPKYAGMFGVDVGSEARHTRIGLESSVYLKVPIDLERYLVEGNYNKIFLLEANLPADTYLPFFNALKNTVREEMASCIAAAYTRLGYEDCARLLGFRIKTTENPTGWRDSEIEFRAFLEKRKWKLNDKQLEFGESRGDDTDTNAVRESPLGHVREMTDFCLGTAIELELIV